MNRPAPIKILASCAMAAAMLSMSDGASSQYAVSEVPTLSTSNPPTNLAVMIDDSGSMAAAFVPDDYGSCAGTRAFDASTFNALAYNPNITYPVPSIITSSGVTPLNAGPSVLTNPPTLTAVYVDGFNPATGTIDLSAGYQPTYTWSPGSSSQSYAAHPFLDMATIGVTSPGGGTGGGCIIVNSASTGNPNNGNGNGNGGFGGGNGNGNKVGAPAYYYVYSLTASASCSASIFDDNCYQYVRVSKKSGPNGTDETVNFANWYAFYRTRHLMIASAAAITMADPALSQTRVTWRSLNTCKDMTAGNNCTTGGSVTVDNRIRTFSGAQVNSFYTWLTNVPVADSTPMRTTWQYIGDYFSNTTLGANGPYGSNPNPLSGTAPPGEVACVRNYSITLTDGQWNSDTGPFFGAADHTATTFPDGTAYPPSSFASAPTAIFGNDSNSDALADIAFHYWATNLRPDLANSTTALKPYYVPGTASPPTTADYWNPQNDPATWPHLVQMTIGIGMTTTMTATGRPWWGNNNATQYSSPGYTNLYNGGPTYPWPPIGGGGDGFGGDIGKAYDLWHAGVNSRGVAFSAESPADLILALKTSLNRVKATMAAQSAAAVSSSSLQTNTVVYLANYTSDDWHGELGAFSFTGGVLGAKIWKTTDGGKFSSASTRSIATSKSGIPGSGNGIPFTSTDLSSNSLAPGLTGTNSTVLDWLRGDQSLEQPAGAYRARKTSILGDIVDSGPVFTFQEDFGYSALPEGMGTTPNYSAYLKTKGMSTGSVYQGAGMVYVGANDGMLHGFDANSGAEVFSYVPYSVLPNLPALSDPNYAHQFYVDQTPYVGDACLGGSGFTNCTWKSVLVGTTGAGGQGVFAIDVSNPAGMESSSGAAGKVLWELTGQSASNTGGDPDLGFSIGKPIIARLNNGDWSAIFGNGYLSSNGCAVLFIVRLSDGHVTKIGTTMTPGTSVCTTGNLNLSNGLGPVSLSDPTGNFTTDYVYAGDLQGNLWKFDLHTAALATSPASSVGTPLFTASSNGGTGCTGTYPAASTCQAITSAPVLGPAPATGGLSGTMVYFGTGRLFAIGDSATTTPQSFYGILDSGSAITGGQSALVQETVTTSGNFRSIGTTPFTLASHGWFLNLPASGERVTMSPILADGVALFATVIPGSDACSGGGSGWLMAVSATTNTVGGTNLFMSGSTGYDGVKSTWGTIEGLTVVSDPANNRDVAVVSGSTGIGSQGLTTKRAKGRISWHELTR